MTLTSTPDAEGIVPAVVFGCALALLAVALPRRFELVQRAALQRSGEPTRFAFFFNG
jgi:hypothetical protein